MNIKQPEFLPVDLKSMQQAGFDELDILVITGDCYVDHPSFGAALIGRLLIDCGWRVGVVAQPDWNNPESLKVMGTPRLGVAVTSGNMDSMVNIYTAGRRKRREDMFSENGQTGKRPPHALVVYSQLAKRAFPGVPVVSGGLEASLRRIAHYDYWQDKIRPSILADTKNDILIYGMGERPLPEVFRRLENKESLAVIPCTDRLLGKKAAEEFDPKDAYVTLPSYEEVLSNPDALMTSTKLQEQEMNPFGGKGLLQWHGDRLLVIEPPPLPLETAELDRVHELPYAWKAHPMYKGRIPAADAVIGSIQAVRGCPGGCAFCGLVSHQGRCVTSRSADSLWRELDEMVKSPIFRGTVSDVGGAAGNLFGAKVNPEICAKCHRSSCLVPKICPNFKCDGKELVQVLRRLSSHPKVKHLFINSGIRLDLALKQPELLDEMVRHHVSGHLKVAPEHLDDEVLRLMRKNPAADFYRFQEEFERISKDANLEQYIIPLFISNFPGCTAQAMKTVDDFLNRHKWSLQQVQDYIPLPMTMGAAMYYCGKDSDGNVIHVNRGLAERRPQIEVLKKRRSGPEKNSFNNKGSKKFDNNRKNDFNKKNNTNNNNNFGSNRENSFSSKNSFTGRKKYGK